jgi:hypothetical protein
MGSDQAFAIGCPRRGMAARSVSDPSHKTGVHRSIETGMAQVLFVRAAQVRSARPNGTRMRAGGIASEPGGG